MAAAHDSPPLLVHPAEEALGLGDAIRAAAAVRLEGVARHDPAGELPGPVRAALLATAAAALPPDLYPLDAVLASTGVNLNDDFFTPEDTWAAKDTPVDKPFNFEHAFPDIIGHMTAARPFVYGDDGAPVAIAEPRDAFHLAFSAFLYRYWAGNADAQERMDRTLEEIGRGEWKVSMECRFPTFDYALIPVRGGKADAARAQIVARTPDTAHLTRALRAYGGPGTYQGYRVARVLRAFAFSAVGLVRTPANPPSVILTHGDAAAGYEPDSDTPKGQSMNELDTLKAELAEAKAGKKAAEDVAAKAAADLAAAKAELAAATATVETLTASVTAARTEAETARAALAKAELDAKQAARAAKVKEAYGLATDADAEKTAANLMPLTDEAFDAHLKAVAELKATSLKLGEQKVTGKPTPMAGGAKPAQAAAAAVASDLLAAPAPAPAAPEPALAVAAAPPEDLVKLAQAEMDAYFKAIRTKK